MTVTFVGNFSKRRNSTKQPSGGTSKTVLLKEGTSMMRPAFLLSSVSYNWNYCIWDGRYYYVTDIVSESNTLFRVECELDTLATFKNAIGNYNTLISRSDSAFNTHVMDTIYPSKADPYTQSTIISNPGLFTTNRAAGTIVMGVVGHGGQTLVVMPPASFASMCSVLFPVITQTPDVYFAATISEALVGGLNTIMQSIVLLKWLPIDWSVVVSQLGLSTIPELYVGQIKFDFTGGVAVYALTGNTVVTTSANLITFPGRRSSPAITHQGDWLYMQPFADYTLSAPPFGLIKVDGSFLVPGNMQLQATVRLEIISGNAQLVLNYNDTGAKSCGKFNTCVSYDIKAGGGSSNVLGSLGSVASAAFAFASKNYAGAAASIMGAAEAMIPQSGQIGSGISGPVPDLADNWFAKSTYYDPVEENRAELGRPLVEMRTINTLSGFVKCADAQISIPGHAEEMAEVNSYLNSGFFYE